MEESYESVVLLHGEEARAALKILEHDGIEAALEHLRSWYQPGQGTLISSDEHPWKASDTVYDDGAGYVMYYDAQAPYIGLVSRIEFDEPI